MTVAGLDDTDSRAGLCTTYAAARLADALEERGHRVARTLLVRLNPAVEFKTRGNAALAVHTDAPVDAAVECARPLLDGAADGEHTDPGLVVAPGDPGDVPDAVADFARTAVRGYHEVGDAAALAADAGYRTAHRGNGRGRIGALAAVGAWAAFDEWTYEHIAYRHPERRGTDRDVDRESVFAAADRAYPDAWDTVDRGAGEAVCVPHTPGPLLYGIRGDDPAAVRAVADGVESEPIERTRLFHANQGTDAHLRDASLDDVRDGFAYRVTGIVADAPETREGGHVFVSIAADGEELPCAAFEPTKRFRDRVRALRPGDRITACGEVARGTLKLEKFAVRDLVTTERVVPTCECGRRMESAGAGQGYRCRDCGATAPGRVERSVERDLDVGWYEVPPRARRHVARPLVRGCFDAPVHPER